MFKARYHKIRMSLELAPGIFDGVRSVLLSANPRISLLSEPIRLTLTSFIDLDVGLGLIIGPPTTVALPFKALGVVSFT